MSGKRFLTATLKTTCRDLNAWVELEQTPFRRTLANPAWLVVRPADVVGAN